MVYHASLVLKECTVPCLGAGGSRIRFGLHGTAALVSNYHEATPDQALTMCRLRSQEVLGPFGVPLTSALTRGVWWGGALAAGFPVCFVFALSPRWLVVH